MPLRWLTVDLYYMVFYLPKLRSRPRGERSSCPRPGVVVARLAALVATGHGVDLLVLYFLPPPGGPRASPARSTTCPTTGCTTRRRRTASRRTRNRVGVERVLTPLLLYQNYHLVHHLHPVVPFYRYVAVWRRNEEQYLADDPALSTSAGARSRRTSTGGCASWPTTEGGAPALPGRSRAC